MGKLEKYLWVVAIAMVVIILVTTWIALERGGYEMNPIMWRLFKALHEFTGSWAVAVLPFIPVVCLGLYVMVRAIRWDLKGRGYPYGGRVVLVSFILLILPNTIYNLGVKMSYGLMVVSGFALIISYWIFEWFRWRKERKRRAKKMRK
ncbi:MAG TPA: hypothetical protein EYP46_02455 [Hadesarchaea archaeon]|nr:hypothetical protein [Hadesarchaea archaeon]